MLYHSYIEDEEEKKKKEEEEENFLKHTLRFIIFTFLKYTIFMHLMNNLSIYITMYLNIHT